MLHSSLAAESADVKAGSTPVEMMDEFCRERADEALVQGEFDFGKTDRKANAGPVFNPDDAANDVGFDEDRYEEEKWLPVYELIEDSIGSYGQADRVIGKDALRRRSWPRRPVVASYLDDSGSQAVSVRFVMRDPLDSEFYEERHPLLGLIAAAIPKGFVAEFAEADESGRSDRFVGDKQVVAKAVSRESDRYGVEADDEYDVIETLVISPVNTVSERQENPDDYKADDLFIRGDEYEKRTADLSGSGDSIEVDFPAWALDYAVNAEPGSVSRAEKQQIDRWFEMMGREGYDTDAVSYGDEECFSSDPEFGMPCDCVKAKLAKKALDEFVCESRATADDPVVRYLSQGLVESGTTTFRTRSGKLRRT